MGWGTLRRAAMLAAWTACAARAAVAQETGAETCTCRDASFAWRGCADGDCDEAGWTGCEGATPDDTYVIGPGCHVRVGPGDDVLLAPDAAAPVVVQAGGSLTVGGPVEWRVGPRGLVGEPGSSVAFSGCYRRRGSNGPDCAPALGPDALFTVGEVVPCRDLDCSDDPEIVRLVYEPEVQSSAIAGLLARIDATRDALCFWQDDRSNAAVGADAGYCYAITGVGEAARSQWIDFDIRQVWRAKSDQAGYPLERREVHEATLLGDHAGGARTLRFRETDVVVGRTDQMGRWVRCGGEQRAYLVATVRDDPGGDALVLADDRGLEHGFPDATRCHVDWGWAAGDKAFVMAPVHVTSATNRSDEGFVLLQGAASLGGVVIDGLGGDGLRGALQLRGADMTRFEHVWVTDPLVTDTEAVLVDDVPCGRGVFHLSVTGGPPDAADDKNYGLAWFGGSACNYSLTHLYTRFVGDDSFVLESTGAAPVGAIHWRHVQAGPASRPGDSGQFLDFGFPNPTDVVGSGGICTACTSQDGFGPLVSPSSGTGEMSGIVWVGAFNGGLHGDGTESDRPDYRYRRLAVVGSAPDPSIERGIGAIAGLNTEDFYVRDVEDPRPDPNRLCTANPYGTFARRLARGIFANVALGGVPCEVGGGDAELSDLYFLDVTRSDAGGAIVETRSAAPGARLARLTMAFANPPAGVWSGVRVTTEAAPSTVLDGLLLTGVRGPGARAMSLGSAANAQAVAWGAPSCFWDNDVDEEPAVLDAYGVAPIRGVAPGWVDASASRYDLAPDSPLRAAGCGAGTAGIRDADWAHRKLKLRPLYMGPPPAACGLAGPELLALVLACRIRRLSLRRRRDQASGAARPGRTDSARTPRNSPV